jgi:hypothetical protein
MLPCGICKSVSLNVGDDTAGLYKKIPVSDVEKRCLVMCDDQG